VVAQTRAKDKIEQRDFPAITGRLPEVNGKYEGPETNQFTELQD